MLIYNYINVLNMLKCISRNLLTRVNFTLSTRKLLKKKKKKRNYRPVLFRKINYWWIVLVN